MRRRKKEESTKHKKGQEATQKTYFQGIEVDLSRIGDPRYFAKKASQILNNKDSPVDRESFEMRVILVNLLERILKTDFKNTSDFRGKIGRFVDGYDLRKDKVSERIRKARKKERLTQQQLADKLLFKKHTSIAQYETGKRYPPRHVLEWLESVECNKNMEFRPKVLPPISPVTSTEEKERGICQKPGSLRLLVKHEKAIKEKDGNQQEETKAA